MTMDVQNDLAGVANQFFRSLKVALEDRECVMTGKWFPVSRAFLADADWNQRKASILIKVGRYRSRDRQSVACRVKSIFWSDRHDTPGTTIKEPREGWNFDVLADRIVTQMKRSIDEENEARLLVEESGLPGVGISVDVQPSRWHEDNGGVSRFNVELGLLTVDQVRAVLGVLTGRGQEVTR